ncbi:MAG: serine hydrolase domain-containing protein [Bacillota bacterium]
MTIDKQKLDTYLSKVKHSVPTLQVYIESGKTEDVYQFSSTHLNQTFHSASVGKVFCATLIMKAIEEARLSLDSRITDYLDNTMLNNLFVYKGVDYKDSVTVEILLNHTSGVNDYFEGKTINNTPFLDSVFKQKDHLYTPKELLDFTRHHQHAVGKPKDRFYYSDTGYVLLGLLLEAVYSMPYYKILKEKLITPLNLTQTALCFHDPNFNQKALAPLYFNHQDMSQATSLSCDYSGGGLQTTTKDLASFLKALFQGNIISKKSLQKMMHTKYRFHGIMRYGLGLVEIKFHKIMPWKLNYPTLYGGLGSLSVHAFYDPKHDDVYIINLGDASKMRLSFMVLTRLARELKRINRNLT